MLEKLTQGFRNARLKLQGKAELSEENIKHALHFPELIPPELSPPFEFCISTPKGSAMSVSDGVKHYEISVMEKKC